jgi:hypothetical protein
MADMVSRVTLSGASMSYKSNADSQAHQFMFAVSCLVFRDCCLPDKHRCWQVQLALASCGSCKREYPCTLRARAALHAEMYQHAFLHECFCSFTYIRRLEKLYSALKDTQQGCMQG